MALQYETDMTIVLDRSGSMGSVINETIEGYNRMLRRQRELPDRCRLTLIQFDDRTESVYVAKDLKEAAELDFETYQPRGATALLDAIGTSIRLASTRLLAIPEDERPRHVVFVILTDGLENASSEFDRKLVFDMIRHQRRQNRWQFVFLGANQDAIAEARGIGIPAHAARGFESENGGSLEIWETVCKGLQSLRTSQTREVPFFSAPDTPARPQKTTDPSSS
ncbi:vWA domain-containing protein [Thalassoroseus pseudoceratinae]|uniref:vWA domain-containing protein n=1 Tax=Thalassoroseus pseudoceratinae TaxID=2713176 RepID=UPI00141DB954|nr:vWA domain-containing protein [Thalassoroseus pseudoceratinae]